jgi:hypothetical protein
MLDSSCQWPWRNVLSNNFHNQEPCIESADSNARTRCFTVQARARWLDPDVATASPNRPTSPPQQGSLHSQNCCRTISSALAVCSTPGVSLTEGLCGQGSSHRQEHSAGSFSSVRHYGTLSAVEGVVASGGGPSAPRPARPGVGACRPVWKIVLWKLLDAGLPRFLSARKPTSSFPTSHTHPGAIGASATRCAYGSHSSNVSHVQAAHSDTHSLMCVHMCYELGNGREG